MQRKGPFPNRALLALSCFTILLIATDASRMDAACYELQIVEYKIGGKVIRVAINKLDILPGRFNKGNRENKELLDPRDSRYRDFLDTLQEVEKSGIPFSDEPPIVWPDGSVWEALTERRKRYSSIDLENHSVQEKKILRQLGQETEFQFIETPLEDVVDYLREFHGIEIKLDARALDDVGIGLDAPVTKSLKGISLRSALRLMLNDLELTYMIQDEVLIVTTPEEAEANLVTKVYPVGDLVIPIESGGGMNPFMMGGGMGRGGGFGGGREQGDGFMFVPNGIAPRDQFAANTSEVSRRANMSDFAVPCCGLTTDEDWPSRTLVAAGGSTVPATILSATLATQQNGEEAGAGGKGKKKKCKKKTEKLKKQSRKVQEEIADLLNQLRKMQDLQVSVEVHFVTLNDNFFERIGVDFDFDIDDNTGFTPVELPSRLDDGPSVTIGLDPSGAPTADLSIPFAQGSFASTVPQYGGFDAATAANFGFAILSDIEAYFLIQAAQGDNRSNIMQAPKVTLFNGQQAFVSDTSQTPFVTSVIPVVGDYENHLGKRARRAGSSSSREQNVEHRRQQSIAIDEDFQYKRIKSPRLALGQPIGITSAMGAAFAGTGAAGGSSGEDECQRCIVTTYTIEFCADDEDEDDPQTLPKRRPVEKCPPITRPGSPGQVAVANQQQPTHRPVPVNKEQWELHRIGLTNDTMARLAAKQPKKSLRERSLLTHVLYAGHARHPLAQPARMRNQLRSDLKKETLSKATEQLLLGALDDFAQDRRSSVPKLAATPIAAPDENVVVAVIDTGLDFSHLELWGQLWRNPGEIPFNRIDDDRNGYVDDLYGYNFIDDSTDLWDDNGHGTAVAGVIAARSDNRGMVGVSPAARLMILKTGDAKGQTDSRRTALAMRYAVQQGAKIIHVSAETSPPTKLDQAMVDWATERGVLVVTAAGSSSRDTANVSPAGLNGVLTVGACDKDDKRASFSGWGKDVDLVAPGVSVLSLRAGDTDFVHEMAGEFLGIKAGERVVDDRWYRADGTSFSAPFVTGVAAALWAKNPDLTPQQIKNKLIMSCDDIEQTGWDILTGAGRLNAAKALEADPDQFLHTSIISANLRGDNESQRVQVTGSAFGSDLRRRWIQVAFGNAPGQDDWTTVQTSDKQVVDGVIGHVPHDQFHRRGVWQIRSLVADRQGHTRESRWRINVQ